MTLKILILALIFVISPILNGMLVNLKNDDKKNLILDFIIGFLLNFGIAQIIIVPAIYMKKSFNLVFILYLISIVILGILSIILNIKNYKEILKENIAQIKKIPKTSIILLCLVILQCYIAFAYTHIDDDDAIYVGTATTSIQTNTLFKYMSQTGDIAGKISNQYALSPFPIYLAIISKCVNIAPAIMAHTIFPVIFIIAIYLLFYMLGCELFENDKNSAILFTIFIILLNIFGNYSNRTSFSYLLFRIWQGKALLSNLILPAIWLYILKAIKNDFKFQDCFAILVIVLAGSLCSTQSIGMMPISIVVLTCIYAIKNKKLNYLIKGVACCIPSIIYGILYVIL